MQTKQQDGKSKKQPSKRKPDLVVSVTNWRPAREVFRAFIQAHPELGLRFSEVTFHRFSAAHGPVLTAQGVWRKAGLRCPAIADITRFDVVAFDLVTLKQPEHAAELIKLGKA